ncbi:MAG: glycosyltransferase family 2 protein [Candidatus Hydrogenedentes bacterium]|nr:glycosyltransferase family 2 protein [Candidatus Hydrogenedentota bacterium]
MVPRVSVIVPTWNHKEMLGDCLYSLETQTYDAMEIVVVDDGSTDGTAEFVHLYFPGVRVIRQEKNRGFCAAVNAGIRSAATEYIILLNNDMTVHSKFVAWLVSAADSSNAALFAPLVLFRDDLTYIYCAGDMQLRNGRPESIGYRSFESGFQEPDEIFGVSAGAALYRREVFEQVGLFDERFHAYFEDSDFNFRARLAGFTAKFVRAALAYHVGSASLEGRTWWRSRQCYRNHALLVLKNFPLPVLIRNAPGILMERFNQTSRLLSSARAEFGLARALCILMKTWLSMMTAIPHCLAERRRIQRSRKISIPELNRLLDMAEEP